MKTSALIIAGCVASASAFAPASNGRVVSSLAAKAPEPAPAKKSLFRTISEMDLFAPNKTQNDYGARSKKDMKVASLGNNSYIPSGLTKDQYEKLRKNESVKKSANYEKNVKKAGVFEDYTEFYTKRGTDTKADWKKDVTLGHRMAKTKFDWSGNKDTPLWAKQADKKK